jgi:PncC family amidohydrolase
MNLVDQIVKNLLAKNETLSVAESCTGGGLAYEIAQKPGVSPIFLGGVVSYANEAKTNLLSISKSVLEQHGAVSREVALLMAKNCCQVFSSSWALSTTGISGPTGGSKSKPVGLVWIGICGPSIADAKDYLFARISRTDHQKRTIQEALTLLLQQLDNTGRLP